MTSDKILTFEFSPDGRELEIHADDKGLNELIGCLPRTLRIREHDHLMTPDWGGTELTQAPQGESDRRVNKVTVRVWDEM